MPEVKDVLEVLGLDVGAGPEPSEEVVEVWRIIAAIRGPGGPWVVAPEVPLEVFVSLSAAGMLPYTSVEEDANGGQYLSSTLMIGEVNARLVSVTFAALPPSLGDEEMTKGLRDLLDGAAGGGDEQ